MRVLCCALAFSLVAASALAAEYKVAKLKEGPPEEVSKAMAKQLAETGIRVSEGDEPVCDIWTLKEWAVKPDFKPSPSVLYPFWEGQLLGVIRYHKGKRHTDFRQQRIRSGVYTLRYGLQPVDGNHVGTSDTRDFMLVLKASEDTDPAPLGEQKLNQQSAAAVRTTHPGILSLRPLEGDVKEVPAMRHNEGDELWIVRFGTTGKAGDKTKETVLDMVIEGHASEF